MQAIFTAWHLAGDLHRALLWTTLGGGQRAVPGDTLQVVDGHAKIIALKGDSYRLKDRDLGRVPAATIDDT